MSVLATPGVLIRVAPGDDVIVHWEQEVEVVTDWIPFEFRVEGRLNDGQIFYGLYGPVTSGPEMYQGLICNILVRVDGTDWRQSSKCQANFIVGPSRVERNHCYDFRHPDGTTMNGFPVISRFGDICVVN